MFDNKTEIYCPKCGKLMKRNTDMILTSLPPQYQYECDNCGYILYSSSVRDTTITTNVDKNPFPSVVYQGWICPICGTPISPYTDCCPICTKKQSTTLGSGQPPIVTKWMNTAISSAESPMKGEKG